MPLATMTSKGQITVPKEVREDLHLSAGSKVLFVKLRNGQYRVLPRTGKVQDLAGMLYDPSEAPMTIDDINDAIAEGGAASGLTGLE